MEATVASVTYLVLDVLDLLHDGRHGCGTRRGAGKVLERPPDPHARARGFARLDAEGEGEENVREVARGFCFGGGGRRRGRAHRGLTYEMGLIVWVSPSLSPIATAKKFN